MLGIVVATHGTMSDGLKDAVNTIVGIADNIQTCNLLSGQAVENLGADIQKAVEDADQGDGVVIFTDLVSASPYNQSMMAISHLATDQQAGIYIIGGVNLPMLLEAVNHQLLNTNIKEAVAAIVQQGSASIGTWHVSDLDQSESDDDDF